MSSPHFVTWLHVDGTPLMSQASPFMPHLVPQVGSHVKFELDSPQRALELGASPLMQRNPGASWLVTGVCTTHQENSKTYDWETRTTVYVALDI